MKSILLFICYLLLGSHRLLANEVSNCDQIIANEEEVEISPAISLMSYLKFLIDSGIVTLKDLSKFKHSLHTSKIINPIFHKTSNASNRAHFLQIQKYLDYQQINHQFINLNELDQLIDQYVQTKKIDSSSRKNIQITANFDFVLEKLIEKNSTELLRMFFELMIKNAPKSTKKLALQLINSKNSSLNSIAVELILKQPHYENLIDIFKNHINRLDARDSVQSFINFVKFTDISDVEDFYRFAIKILSAKIHPAYKQSILETIALKSTRIDDPNLVQAIKDITLVNANIDDSSIMKLAVKILADHQTTDKIVPFFIDMVKNSAIYNPYATGSAISSLFKFKIEGHHFDFPDFSYFINKYSIYMIDLKVLKNLSDPISLQIIKDLYNLSNNKKMSIIALLKGRNDDESLLFIKEIFPLFLSREQLKLKLEILSGRDAPWILNFIKQNLTHQDLEIRDAAYFALENMSSIESRILIEKLFLDKSKRINSRIDEPDQENVGHKNKNQLKIEIELLQKALAKRSEVDSFYFINKYINSDKKELAALSIKNFKGIKNPKIEKICNEKISLERGTINQACIEYFISIGFYHKNAILYCFETLKMNINAKTKEMNDLSDNLSACINYLSLFSTEQHIELWKQLAKPPFSSLIEILAITKLIKANDQESKKLLISVLETSPENASPQLFELINWAPITNAIKKCESLNGNNLTLNCFLYMQHQPFHIHQQWWTDLIQKYNSDDLKERGFLFIAEHFNLVIKKTFLELSNNSHSNFDNTLNSFLLYQYMVLMEKIENNVPLTDEENSFFE